MALTNHFMSRCESDLRAVQHGPITTLPFWAFPPYDLAAPSGAAFFFGLLPISKRLTFLTFPAAWVLATDWRKRHSRPWVACFGAADGRNFRTTGE